MTTHASDNGNGNGEKGAAWRWVVTMLLTVVLSIVGSVGSIIGVGSGLVQRFVTVENRQQFIMERVAKSEAKHADYDRSQQDQDLAFATLRAELKADIHLLQQDVQRRDDLMTGAVGRIEAALKDLKDDIRSMQRKGTNGG